MIFTTIATNVDRYLAHAAAFARNSYEFRRDLGWADPAPFVGISYTELDEASDHGRDVAHQDLRRFLDGDERSDERPAVSRIALPPKLSVAVSTHAAPPPDGFPMSLICEGEVEYPEDDSIYGTYWLQTSRDLGEYTSIEEAISAASRILTTGSFDLDDSEALSFAPSLFLVRDRDQRLVLAGHVLSNGIRWCEPVASNDEVVRVHAEVSQTNAEAAFEAGWDNHSTARMLRFRARVLEGHLVDEVWRARARHALTATNAGRSPCPSPSDPLPVPSYAAYRA